jgi:hypothetical protein
LESFEMSAPSSLCKIVSYHLDPSLDQTGITKKCASPTDCRSLTFETSLERAYEFRYIITSNAQAGDEKLITQVLTTKITCGAEI